jgi:hypothetical protein
MPKVKPQEGVAQTVIENDVDGPAKSVTMTSPWGTKVTVDAEANIEDFKNLGYKASK